MSETKPDYEILSEEVTQANFSFKIIVIGDSAVGKSNLLLRYAHDRFNDEYQATIGVEFVYKTLKIGKEVIKVEVWDTAGQERYRSITSSYYKGARGAIIVYDITNDDSFHNVESWMNEVVKKGKKDIQFLLLGNKSDLVNDRLVSEEKGIEKARELNMRLFEASALDKTNVNEAFNYLIKEIYLDVRREKMNNNNNLNDNINVRGIELNTNKTDKKKCCQK